MVGEDEILTNSMTLMKTITDKYLIREKDQDGTTQDDESDEEDEELRDVVIGTTVHIFDYSSVELTLLKAITVMTQFSEKKTSLIKQMASAKVIQKLINLIDNRDIRGTALKCLGAFLVIEDR